MPIALELSFSNNDSKLNASIDKMFDDKGKEYRCLCGCCICNCRPYILFTGTSGP